MRYSGTDSPILSIETLDGSGQALAVQGVAGDFLGLAVVGRLVDG